MNCSRHDVVLLPIPFTDLSSQKVRPAVVVGRLHPTDVATLQTHLRNWLGL
jgi:hypothetical protein